MNKKNIILLFSIPLSVGRVSAQSAECSYEKIVEMQNEDGTDSIVSIQYYDEAGRATESLTSITKGKYLHALNTYDPMGRVLRTWLRVTTGSEEALQEGAFQSVSSQQYADPSAYISNLYDALDRPVFSSTQGSAWAGKGKTVEYGTNPDSLVKHYDATSLRNHSGEQDIEYYPKGTLSYTKAITEDGQTMTTYTDFLGNVVLDRRGTDNDTYYVYDEKCQLRYVLSPQYQEEPSLEKFAYQYEYDAFGRCIRKTIPGCEYIQYWYDDADRIVKMQDGVLRTRGKYRVYTYDALGRLTKQSISDGDRVEYDEIVNFYDTYDYLKDPNYAHMVPANHVDTTSLCPIRPEYGNGQLTGVWQRASNGENMLMSYNYDDYGRLTMTKEIGLDKHLAVVYQDYNFNGTIHNEHRDLYRYSKTGKALNDNSLWGWISNKYYPSNNKMLQKSVIHLQHKGSEKQTYDEIMMPTYDDFGQMIANDRKGTAGDMSFSYDKLHGWLTQIGSSSGFRQTLYRENSKTGKRYDGSIAAMSWEVGDGSVHTYHYAYDGMNRLTEAVYSSNRDFEDRQKPSMVSDLVSALKGEEPLKLIPMESLQGNYSESYCYDKNCNLTWLQRTGTSNSVKGQVIDLLECSYSGNQLKSVCDYSDEKLNYAGAFDFQDEADDVEEYSYNENGAMTKDLNKGITNIEYDLLGNPRKVTMTGNRFIEYVYAADGRKLRTVHVAIAYSPVIQQPDKGLLFPSSGMDPWSPATNVHMYLSDTTDYINNYVFKDGKPEMFRFNGGYYSFDEEGKMDGCHLYVQDYQGNNRMVVNAYTDEVEQINHYYPYGALMADISTNPNEQKYKYGEKELDRKFGLDLYDFEARQQDPLVGRFTSIDPLAEDAPQASPYAYCEGDPINFIDPTGMNKFILFPDGRIVLARITDDGFDELFAQDANGKFTIRIRVNDYGAVPELSNYGFVASSDDLLDLFFFLHDHAKLIEWSITKFEDGENVIARGEGKHGPYDGSAPSFEATSKYAGKKVTDVILHMHCHPRDGGDPIPSGNYNSKGKYDNPKKSWGYTDQYVYHELEKKYGKSNMPKMALLYDGQIRYYTWSEYTTESDTRQAFRKKYWGR